MVQAQDIDSADNAGLARIAQDAGRFALDLIVAGGPIDPAAVTADVVRAAARHADGDAARQRDAMTAYCDGLMTLSVAIIGEIVQVTGNADAGRHITTMLSTHARAAFDGGAATTLLSSAIAAVRMMRWRLNGSGDRPVIRVEQPMLALGLFQYCGMAMGVLSHATGHSYAGLAPYLRDRTDDTLAAA